MIPIRDAGPRIHGAPLVTWAIIAANLGVFLMMLGGRSPVRQQELTLRYASVPANVVGREPVVWALAEVRQRRQFAWFLSGIDTVAIPAELGPEQREDFLRQQFRQAGARLGRYQIVEPAIPAWLTLITSMFMHGGWLHLLGNMVFLFVFGARLEDRLGGVRFLGFYLLTGVAAALTHVVSDPGSDVPMVGASGAISGLLGGYVLLWPHGRIVTLVPILLVFFIELPAILFVGIWILLQVQLIKGAAATGGGGVAVWAHLGGFLYGLLLIKLFDPLARRRPPPAEDGWRPQSPPSQQFPNVRRPDGWYDDRREWP